MPPQSSRERNSEWRSKGWKHYESANGNSNSRWSSEDVKFMLELVTGGFDMKQVAIALKRSENSVKAKLSAIRKDLLIEEQPTDEEAARDLLELLYSDEPSAPSGSRGSDTGVHEGPPCSSRGVGGGTSVPQGPSSSLIPSPGFVDPSGKGKAPMMSVYPACSGTSSEFSELSMPGYHSPRRPTGVRIQERERDRFFDAQNVGTLSKQAETKSRTAIAVSQPGGACTTEAEGQREDCQSVVVIDTDDDMLDVEAEVTSGAGGKSDPHAPPRSAPVSAAAAERTDGRPNERSERRGRGGRHGGPSSGPGGEPSLGPETLATPSRHEPGRQPPCPSASDAGGTIPMRKVKKFVRKSAACPAGRPQGQQGAAGAAAGGAAPHCNGAGAAPSARPSGGGTEDPTSGGQRAAKSGLEDGGEAQQSAKRQKLGGNPRQEPPSCAPGGGLWLDGGFVPGPRAQGPAAEGQSIAARRVGQGSAQYGDADGGTAPSPARTSGRGGRAKRALSGGGSGTADGGGLCRGAEPSDQEAGCLAGAASQPADSAPRRRRRRQHGGGAEPSHRRGGVEAVPQAEPGAPEGHDAERGGAAERRVRMEGSAGARQNSRAADSWGGAEADRPACAARGGVSPGGLASPSPVGGGQHRGDGLTNQGPGPCNVEAVAPGERSPREASSPRTLGEGGGGPGSDLDDGGSRQWHLPPAGRGHEGVAAVEHRAPVSGQRHPGSARSRQRDGASHSAWSSQEELPAGNESGDAVSGLHSRERAALPMGSEQSHGGHRAVPVALGVRSCPAAPPSLVAEAAAGPMQPTPPSAAGADSEPRSLAETQDCGSTASAGEGRDAGTGGAELQQWPSERREKGDLPHTDLTHASCGSSNTESPSMGEERVGGGSFCAVKEGLRDKQGRAPGASVEARHDRPQDETGVGGPRSISLAHGPAQSAGAGSSGMAGAGTPAKFPAETASHRARPRTSVAATQCALPEEDGPAAGHSTPIRDGTALAGDPRLPSYWGVNFTEEFDSDKLTRSRLRFSH